MSDRRFSEPVTVLVGLGFPHQVNTVFEAYRLLSDWPGGKNPAQAAALNACRSAMTGHIDADTARSAFEAFARRTGVLVPELAVGGTPENPRRHTLQ